MTAVIPPGAVARVRGKTVPLRAESPMTVYRYGALAWFWRLLIALGVLAGGAMVAFAIRFGSPAFLAIAAPLALPALFCGWVVATSVRLDGDRVRVATLLFVTRSIPCERLGRPRVRLRATVLLHQIDAPRLWVPVRGRAPVYLDLYAEIPDRAAFEAVFPLSPAVGAILDDGREDDGRE